MSSVTAPECRFLEVILVWPGFLWSMIQLVVDEPREMLGVKFQIPLVTHQGMGPLDSSDCRATWGWEEVAAEVEEEAEAGKECMTSIHLVCSTFCNSRRPVSLWPNRWPA